MAREYLDAGGICLNVLFSIMIILCAVLNIVGIATYEWIEVTDDQLADNYGYSGADPYGVPGFSKASCGIVSYCMQATGVVSECSLPWPLIGGSASALGGVSGYWAATAALVIIGVLITLSVWFYTVVACFGCYHQKTQDNMCKALDAAAFFELIALIVWGFSFSQYAAADRTTNPIAEARCTEANFAPGCNVIWPSPVVMGGADNTGCAICGPDTSMFQLQNCEFGWGGIITVVGCVLTFITAAVGHCIKPSGIDGLKHGREPANRVRGTKETYVA